MCELRSAGWCLRQSPHVGMILVASIDGQGFSGAHGTDRVSFTPTTSIQTRRPQYSDPAATGSYATGPPRGAGAAAKVVRQTTKPSTSSSDAGSRASQSGGSPRVKRAYNPSGPDRSRCQS